MSDSIRREDVKFEVGDTALLVLSNGTEAYGVVEEVADDYVRYATKDVRPNFKVTAPDGSRMAPFCSMAIERNNIQITE